MKINVPHIAKLANLTLSPKQVEIFESQLQSILNYIEKLNEVDTKNIEETSQVTGLENITKNDETSPSFSQEEALSNTKSQQNGLFKVKGVFSEE